MYDVRGKNSAGTIANPASESNAQTYVVRKLADGNCWMIQNLNLDLSNNVTLDSTTSDLTTGRTWTPQYSTQTTEGTVWAQDGGDVARSYEPGSIFLPGGVGFGVMDEGTLNYSGYATSGESWEHLGNYYNWYAATAGTGTAAMVSGNAADSICPKNWKLPDNVGVKSFVNLIYATYGLIDNDAASSDKILASPLSFVRSGDYFWPGARIGSRGNGGYWWSSTVYDAINAHYLGTGSVRNVPQNWSHKGHGLSIRCVAR